MTTKIHLVCDGKARALAFVLTGGQVADTSRRKRPGRPIDFGDDQRERYKGRNVVERCFNFVKQWRGLASRYDKTARSYAAGICLSAALQWI